MNNEEHFKKIINHIGNSSDNNKFQCNINDVIETSIYRINSYPTNSPANSFLKRASKSICFISYKTNIIKLLNQYAQNKIDCTIFNLEFYMRSILREIFNKYKIEKTDVKSEIKIDDKVIYYTTDKKGDNKSNNAVIEHINTVNGTTTYNLKYDSTGFFGTKSIAKNVTRDQINTCTSDEEINIGKTKFKSCDNIKNCENLFLEKFFSTRDTDVFTSYIALINSETEINIKCYNEITGKLIGYNNFIMNPENNNNNLLHDETKVQCKIKDIIGNMKLFQNAIRKSLGVYKDETKNSININIIINNNVLQDFHDNIFKYINQAIASSHKNNGGSNRKRRTKITRKNKIAGRRSRKTNIP